MLIASVPDSAELASFLQVEGPPAEGFSGKRPERREERRMGRVIKLARPQSASAAGRRPRAAVCARAADVRAAADWGTRRKSITLNHGMIGSNDRTTALPARTRTRSVAAGRKSERARPAGGTEMQHRLLGRSERCLEAERAMHFCAGRENFAGSRSKSR